MRSRGWMPASVRLKSKVKVTFMNCRSDQGKKREKKPPHTHTHTQKFKMANLNKTSGEGENSVFPKCKVSNNFCKYYSLKKLS